MYSLNAGVFLTSGGNWKTAQQMIEEPTRQTAAKTCCPL